MKKLVALMIIVAMLCIMMIAIAQETKKEEKTEFKYVGVKKCYMCHKGERKGEIYEKWLSRKHSKAYETLASEQSMQVAKEAGIKGEPQEAPECLVCHVTGYNAPDSQKEETLTLEEGVSCEACHGPGSEYKSLKVMKGITKGELDGAEYGLADPDEANCKTCHNEKSPTYKEFVYEEAVKQIAHPLPEKK